MTALLVVEDNVTFAQTVTAFLRQLKGYTVVGLAGTAEEALAKLAELTVDLVLVDVSLPSISGIELVAAIGRQYPDLRCIVLSGHHEPVYVRRALEAGARAYVLKEHPLDLIAAVRAVQAGETYLSAELRS